jgi:putative ABC transport system permease protein
MNAQGVDAGRRRGDDGAGLRGGLLVAANRRHLARHPWLLALAVLGIALGVATATAVDLAIASARRAFTDASAAVVGHATDQIIGGPRGLADADVVALRRALAPGRVAPVIEADLVVPGRHHVLRLLGVDPLSEAPFRPWMDGARGDGPGAEPGGGAGGGGGVLARLLTVPGAALISADTARALGVGVGDRLPVLVGAERRELVVVGLLPGGDRATADLALCDLATAQEVLGRGGRVDRLDCLLDAAGEARLQAIVLPDGAEAAPAAARTAALVQLTAAFQTNLTALGLIALVVGMFLIHNTATFLVVQRRVLTARLRLAGATRSQVAAALLVETAAIGALGSVLGLGGGIVAGSVLVRLVTRTIGDLWIAAPGAPTLDLPWGTLLADAGLGLAATLAAAALPIREAALTAPAVQAMPSLRGETARRLAPRLALAGLVAVALAAMPLGFAGTWQRTGWAGSITAGFLALGLLIGGYALLVPLAVAWGGRAAGSIAGRLRLPVAAIAARSLAAGLDRTAVAVAALVVASAAGLGIALMVGSFRGAVADWLDSGFHADLYCAAPRAVAASLDEPSLDPALVARLRALPGVGTAVAKRDARVPSDHGRVQVLAVDVSGDADSGAALGSIFLAGDPARAWPAVARGEACVVSEPFAAHHRTALGERLVLTGAHGPVALTVAGVVRDYSSDQGFVLVARAAYRGWYDDDAITTLALTAAPGTSADALAGQARTAAAGTALVVTPVAALRAETLTVFDRTFAITSVVRTLAGAVAFLGVLSALLALALERRREYALLRLHGCTPGQLRWLIVGQAGLTGLFAGLLALPLGQALAAGLTQVINRRAFGWSFALRGDLEQDAFAVGLAVVAALLAALWPAWVVGRQAPAVALREE